MNTTKASILTMTREFIQKNPEANEPEGDMAAAPNAKGTRKKDLTPEQANELRSRQRAIGNELRRMFDDVAREPVPEEFLELLKQIDGKHEG
jgi:Anti-sigma factor NepR